MTRSVVLIGAIAFALAVAAIATVHGARGAPAGEALMVWCAAGVKPAVEAAAARFESECHAPVRLQYGGSGQLLSSIAVAHQGDLFISADASYVDRAVKDGLANERFDLARQRPVLAVAKGNPKRVAGLADLMRDDLRVGLANPDTASIGRVVKRALERRQQWDAFSHHLALMKPTVTEVATDLRIGAIDAAVLWDATLAQVPGLEAVPAPELGDTGECVTAAVLADSAQPTAALRFARFLSAPDRGGREFGARGYTPADGDPWKERPTMTVYSGSVNRAAVGGLIQQFARREGVDIDTVYNGCGILCASMKAAAATPGAKFPDAYYACDICFVPPVASFFPEAVLLTDTPLVIAVPKGNPKGVHSLIDLAQPGMRIGVANAEQASLGFITRRMLERMNLAEAIARNVALQVPTGDLLANEVQVGALDAAIVYSTNARTRPDKLDAIAIDSPAAKAVQPFAVAKDSSNRQLANRLLAYLQQHRSAFTEVGFRWRDEQSPVASGSLPPIGGDLDLKKPAAGGSAHGP